MRRRKGKGHEAGHADESWLLPYSDMMTLLLALFIVMFAFSSIDQEKYKALMKSMHTAFDGASETGDSADQAANYGTGDMPTGFPVADELPFSELYETLSRAVEDQGYQGKIEVLDGSEFVSVRFSESILFKPDSAAMTPAGETALQAIGAILLETQKEIGHIEIGGHTAFIGEEADKRMSAWELSSNRAITVLDFFYSNLGFAQEKMNIAGFSHFVPVAPNDTEQNRAKNRRVELHITPKAPPLSSGSTPGSDRLPTQQMKGAAPVVSAEG